MIRAQRNGPDDASRIEQPRRRRGARRVEQARPGHGARGDPVGGQAELRGHRHIVAADLAGQGGHLTRGCVVSRGAGLLALIEGITRERHGREHGRAQCRDKAAQAPGAPLLASPLRPLVCDARIQKLLFQLS